LKPTAKAYFDGTIRPSDPAPLQCFHSISVASNPTTQTQRTRESNCTEDSRHPKDLPESADAVETAFGSAIAIRQRFLTESDANADAGPDLARNVEIWIHVKFALCSMIMIQMNVESSPLDAEIKWICAP